MDKLNDAFAFISKFFQWYFIVMPWEQAIFIRAGKRHRILGAGLYLKVPFLDMVFIQTTRKRMVDVPVQTVTTKDMHAITIKSGVLYVITDVFKLYNSLYHPETTLINIVMSKISTYVSTRCLAEITPEGIEQALMFENAERDWGLSEVEVKLNNYAVVKTFRLIQDTTQFYTDQLNMKHLGQENR